METSCGSANTANASSCAITHADRNHGLDTGTGGHLNEQGNEKGQRKRQTPLERLWVAISAKQGENEETKARTHSAEAIVDGPGGYITPSRRYSEEEEEARGAGAGHTHTHAHAKMVHKRSHSQPKLSLDHDVERSPVSCRAQLEDGQEYTVVDVSNSKKSQTRDNGDETIPKYRTKAKQGFCVPPSPDEEFVQICAGILRNSSDSAVIEALSNEKVSLCEVLRYYNGPTGWLPWKRDLTLGATTMLLQAVFNVATNLNTRAKANTAIGLHRRFGKAMKEIKLAHDTVFSIFVSTAGGNLRCLKDLIDTGADNYDLEHLIYRCLNESPRAHLLAYFRDEGLNLYLPSHDPSLRVYGTKEEYTPSSEYVTRIKFLMDESRNRTIKLQPNKILSDIDDTFHASFKDCSYPGGIRYPGVQQFYEVLKEGKQPDQILGQLVFVTARPRIAKTYTHSAVRDHGSGDVTVLTGSFKNFLTHTRMANKKADNFRKYAELYPESHVIIVGDTGQGDIAAAKTSLSQFRQMQRNIPHVFMHDVVTDKASQARLYDNNQRRSLALEGIFLFDSYVDAGLLALQHGLISPAQACSIQQCTYEELLAICSCDEPNRYEIESVGRLVCQPDAKAYVRRRTEKGSKTILGEESFQGKVKDEPSHLDIKVAPTLIEHLQSSHPSFSDVPCYDKTFYSEIGFGLYSGTLRADTDTSTPWKDKRMRKRIDEFSRASQRLMDYLNSVYEAIRS